MKSAGKPAVVYTYSGFNTLLLIVGLFVVWAASGSLVAVAGAFVASIHFTVKVRGPGGNVGALWNVVDKAINYTASVEQLGYYDGNMYDALEEAVKAYKKVGE